MEPSKTVPISHAPEPRPVVVHELQSLDELELLRSDEILVEVETAWSQTDDEGGLFDGSLGALVVTDQRVLYLATSIFRRRVQEFIAVPLRDVVSVEAGMRKCALRKRPTVLVSHRVPDGCKETRSFPLDVESLERAQEIVASILWQRHALAERPPPPASLAPENDSEEEDAPLPDLEVSLGRGVASYVNAHGGRLWAWGTPFGETFDAVHVSTEPPPDEEFVRFDYGTGFELNIERGLWNAKGLHLARRWWGLRDGIVAETGLMLSSAD